MQFAFCRFLDQPTYLLLQDAIFYFCILHFAFFCKSTRRLFAICKIKILHFAFFKDDFYWAVSIMEQNFNSVPRRAICKKSILHFAFCNFLQYYQLASLQGAKTRSCILHFAFFCKYAIVQKLSANIDFLQFARSFCIFSQFCKKVMISKYPPLSQTYDLPFARKRSKPQTVCLKARQT